MKTLFGFVIVWLLLALGVHAQTTPLEGLNVGELIKDTLAHGKGDKLLSEYTYMLRWRERRTDKKGQVKETAELYESYIPTLRRQGNTSAILLKLTRKPALWIPLTSRKLSVFAPLNNERLFALRAREIGGRFFPFHVAHFFLRFF